MSEFKIFAFLTTLSLISLGICYRYPNPLKTTMIPTNNYGIKFDKGYNKNSNKTLYIFTGSDKGSTWELSKSIISQSSDINKDGASDLMICSPDAPTTSSETQGGEVYIVYGANSQTLSGEILLPNQLSSVVSSGSLSKINGIYIKSTLYNQSVGSSGAIVGDINGDSTSDFIIGAPGSNVSTFASAGKVYIVLGATHNGNRETEIQSSTTNIIEGKSAGLHLGKQVTGLGDVNGDGLDDFAVGSSSQVYIFFGSSPAGHFNSIDLSSLSSSQGILILGFEFEFIQNLGDINNDGINDIGLGVPSADDNQGKIIVIFGRKNGEFSIYIFQLFLFLLSFPAQINVNSSQFTSETGFIVKGVTKNLKIGGLTVYSGDQLGSSFSNAGDINNDGINDFIIGGLITVIQLNNNFKGSDQLNKYYVIYGSETNNFPLTTKDLAGSKGFAINGQAGDGCGKSAALLDISGDGIVDLILGAPLANNCNKTIQYKLKLAGKANSGRVYVIYGSNFTSDFNLSEINGNNGFVILSYTEDMKFGSSVAALGDFNTSIFFLQQNQSSDGSQDFLIGTKTGSAYLIYGHGKQFYTCHATCKTCNGADADNCLTCITGRYFFDNTCLTSCPSTTIQNQDSMICQQCPDYKFMQIETVFYSYFSKQIQSNGVQYRTCQSCSTNCKTCSAANSTSCLSCSSGYYLFNSECKQCTIGNCGTCIQENHCSQCNSGYYLHQDETTLNYSCKQCDSSCLSCKGEGAQLCINCLIGYFFQIIGEGTGSCTQCAVVDEEIEKAKESENITSSNETSENNNDLRQLAILSSNACQVCADAVKCQTCSDFNFVNNDGKCQKCNSRCRKCTGPYYQNCTICNDGFYYNYITQLCEACYYGCQICKNNICSACTLGFNLTNGVCVQDENKYANYFEVEDAPYPEIKYSKLILVIAVLATVIATIIGILILFSQMIMNCYIKWKEKREEKKREVDQEIDLTKPLTLERTQFYSRNIVIIFQGLLYFIKLYKFKQELNSINEKTVQLIGEFGQNTVKMKALENGIYEIKKLSAKKKDVIVIILVVLFLGRKKKITQY